MDLFDDLTESNELSIYKFADDGTVKISGTTTNSCLNTLDTVLTSLNKWTLKWRMVVNCDPNKTEVICFNTAENNREQIPPQFKLGDKHINTVSQTKVLGLIIDEKLLFTQHAEMIYNKLVIKWILICKSCNRHWGFTQRVMIQLIHTLFLSTMLYASHIWMSEVNMKNINKLYYKIIKSTVGAVFNIKKSLAEVILGLPPVHIQSRMNQVKHFLKININKSHDDKLREFIISHSLPENQTLVELQIALKQMFQFLNWKRNENTDHFSDNDLRVIERRDTSQFCTLSEKSCTYRKSDIRKYTELLWSNSIRNEYLADGYSIIPKPSCIPLPIASTINRESEVLLMSLLYENNLLNDFLHKVNQCESPLCYCGEAVQTPAHIIFQCPKISVDYRDTALRHLVNTTGRVELDTINNTVILNAIRDKPFINILCDILTVHGDNLRHSIDIIN